MCRKILLLLSLGVLYSVYPALSYGAYCPEDMVKIMIFEVTGRRYFCIDRYEYPNRFKAYPKAGVSYYEATNICLKRKKRLCTTSEWRAACQGNADMKYSYGNEYVENMCNTDKGWTNLYEASPSGRASGNLYDMIGNVAEWTKNDDDDKCQMIKGGYWAYGSRANCDVGVCIDPDYKLFFIGFRCCKK